MEYIKIVIDTEGSDKGAEMVVRGVSDALSKYEKLAVLLVGNKDTLLTECEKCGISEGERVEILHASEVITNYDSPAEALFKKTDSSLVKSLESLSKRDDLFGMVNAGSTGALIAGSMRYLPTADRVRPALAAVLPAENGGLTCLCDTGATIDCTAANLVHFAKLGSEFMKTMYRVNAPKVGLLSNGAEPTKGTKVVKEAHELLKAEEGINFIGNIEGNGALSGEADVLVADGFAGNQVLKVTEGIARRIITDIVKLAKKSGEEKYMQLVGYLMGIYDFNSLGAGIILGVKKPVLKAHGAANESSISNAIKMLLNMAENKVIYERNA